MIDFAYLHKGLCGLARAHQANAMAGHPGAAVTGASNEVGSSATGWTCHPMTRPSLTTSWQWQPPLIVELIRSGSTRRQGFGGLFHVINHAAGLTELSRFGYKKLARKGLKAHHQHLQMWRSLPDVEDELGPLRKAEHSPFSPAYWRQSFESQWSARLTHRVKTMFGFVTLLRFAEDAETRKQAEDKFLYLMA